MSIRRLFDAVGGLAAGALDQFPFCAWAGTPCKLSVGLDDAMVVAPKLAPNGQRVVLIHKHQNLRVEIYSARLTGGGPPVRLSAAGEDCGFVAISPDSTRVLYFVLAGTGQPGDPVRRELFSAPIAGPASARVTLAADVSLDDVNVRVSPDSGMVVFAPPERDQLRVVPIAGPASAAQRLTDPFAVGGEVSEFEISASGSVVYRADQVTVGVNDLYRVPLTLSPAPNLPTTTLNGPLAAGGDVAEFTLNSRAVYLADQDTDGVTELYSVRLDGTERVKLNETLHPGWNVRRPGRTRILPDGSRAVYGIGHVDGDGRVFAELYSVPIAGPGSASVRLDHPPLIPPGQIFADDYELSADNSRVVYTMVDQNLDEPALATIALASVPATGPASAGDLLAPYRPWVHLRAQPRQRTCRLHHPGRPGRAEQPLQRPDRRWHPGATKRRREPSGGIPANQRQQHPRRI